MAVEGKKEGKFATLNAGEGRVTKAGSLMNSTLTTETTSSIVLILVMMAVEFILYV